MPKWTIITPVYVGTLEREKQLVRAVKSIKNQTDNDFEYIVVNDGSPMDFKLPKLSNLLLVNKEHEERVVAYNAALKLAKGEYICFLYSDDEY